MNPVARARARRWRVKLPAISNATFHDAFVTRIIIGYNSVIVGAMPRLALTSYYSKFTLAINSSLLNSCIILTPAHLKLTCRRSYLVGMLSSKC